MAYCRADGSSDLYMYSSITGGYMFHLARTTNLGEKDLDFKVPTAEAALHRLKRMKTQGYLIPDYAIERLSKEIEDGTAQDMETKNDKRGV
jgi:hypothetical protein